MLLRKKKIYKYKKDDIGSFIVHWLAFQANVRRWIETTHNNLSWYRYGKNTLDRKVTHAQRETVNNSMERIFPHPTKHQNPACSMNPWVGGILFSHFRCLPSLPVGVVFEGTISSGFVECVMKWRGPSYANGASRLPRAPDIGREICKSLAWIIPGDALFCFMYASISWRCNEEEQQKSYLVVLTMNST